MSSWLNDRVYRLGVNAGMIVTIFGLLGAGGEGIWWVFSECGPFWGFISIAICGFIWAVVLDILYNMWGASDEEELDDGDDA